MSTTTIEPTGAAVVAIAVSAVAIFLLSVAAALSCPRVRVRIVPCWPCRSRKTTNQASDEETHPFQQPQSPSPPSSGTTDEESRRTIPPVESFIEEFPGDNEEEQPLRRRQTEDNTTDDRQICSSCLLWTTDNPIQDTPLDVKLPCGHAFHIECFVRSQLGYTFEFTAPGVLFDNIPSLEAQKENKCPSCGKVYTFVMAGAEGRLASTLVPVYCRRA